MKKSLILICACFMLALTLFSENATAQSSPQAQTSTTDLYTTYNARSNGVSWVTCGRLPLTSGCYSSGLINTSTTPKVFMSISNIGREYIYIVDQGSSQFGTPTLYKYEKVTTITNDSDANVTFNLIKSVKLPLIGGDNVKFTIAQGGGKLLFIGSNAPNSNAVTVNSNDFTISQLPKYCDTTQVGVYVYADPDNHVIVNYDGPGCNAIFNKDGQFTSGGGGESLFPGTRNGTDFVIGN